MADSDYSALLKDFATVIGLLKQPGNPPTTDIDWTWFGDPLGHIVGSGSDPKLGLPAHRDSIGQLLVDMDTLISQSPTSTKPFLDEFSWVPYTIKPVPVSFGVAWNPVSNDPANPAYLELGVGAEFNSSPLDLKLLVNLIKFQNGNVSPLVGDVRLSSPLPPLKNFELKLLAQSANPQLKLKLDAGAFGSRSQTLPPANVNAFAWDSLRIALFIVEAWIDQAAKKTPGDPQFAALVKHFFGLFDSASTSPGPQLPVLPVFPLFGQSSFGTVPDFNGWWAKLQPNGTTIPSALALLWRLAALMSGNEGAKFCSAIGNANAPAGSLFLQLLPGQVATQTPPTNLNQAIGSYTPGQMAGTGAWLGLLNQGPNAFTLTMDIQLPTPGQYVRIPLVQFSGNAISLPNTPDFSSLTPAVLNTLKPLLPFQIEQQAGGILIIHLYSQTLNVQPLSGKFDVSVSLKTGSPVSFQVTLGTLPPFSFPGFQQQDPKTVLANLLQWIVTFVPSGAPGSDQALLVGVLKSAVSFITAELKGTPNPPIGDLLTQIAFAATGIANPDQNNPPLDFQTPWGSLPVYNANNVQLALLYGKRGLDSGKYFHLAPQIIYGPLKVDQIPDFPISIGNLNGALDFGIDSQAPFDGFTVGFSDLRLGVNGGASGLIASLIPNLKEMPGFSLAVTWKAPNSVSVKLTSSGTIPIQLNLGPLNISQLLIDVNNAGLNVGIDLSFKLAVIDISAYQLGLNFDFKTGIPTPSLSGLGLSFDGAGINLSGMFYHNKATDDYVGGALVKVESMFSLTAIGGYTSMKDGAASLFIFASLTAPLGGPPFFFVTGIAGGFGYNRVLPPPTLMGKHPFFKVMRGEIQVSTDPSNGLKAVGAAFVAKEGDYWIAAGVQFVSFGFINGKVIVAVAFGHDFSVNILGTASFGISPIAYFEIDILVTVDKEHFLLKAGVSPSSYLIHPDIFELAGDFALGAWYGGSESAGDFLFSIGGYHPYYKVPAYYPTLNRVSVNATVFGFVHVSIQCFFACTPHALMAGASVSLSAEFAGIGAGLDVYVDVLIQWDPFFILAEMGVDLWFEFLGRHDIGVDLQIHTPPFGGLAHISLFIVSFDVSFGDDFTQLYLPVADMFTKHLAVPATATGAADDAKVEIFNTETKAGLVRVVFTRGTLAKQTADASKRQEGSDPKHPVLVAPEFAFLVKTKLPIERDPSQNSLSLAANGAISVGVKTHLALCNSSDLQSSLSVQVSNLIQNQGNVVLQASYGNYPPALFGPTPLAVQAGDASAQSQIAGIDTKTPKIEMFDGIYFNLNAALNPASQSPMQGPAEELSLGGDNYPLPLDGAQSTYRPKSALSFSNSSVGSKKLPRSNTTSATAAASVQVILPIQNLVPSIVTTANNFLRKVRSTAVITTAVATPPAGAVAMAPPAPSARRVELAGVSLSLLSPRPVKASAQPSIRPINLAQPAVLNTVKPNPAVSQAVTQSSAAKLAIATPSYPQVTVASGQGVHVSIPGGSLLHGTLAISGQQTVRAIFTTGFGEPVADYFVAGSQNLAIPPRSRNLLLIGEGMLAGAPAALGHLGAESSTALYALDAHCFAGHGCVLWARSYHLQKIAPGDTVKSREVLGKASGWSVLFPATGRAAAVVVTVRPRVPHPAAAGSQVRWRAVNASLGGLNTITSADRVVFIMDAQSAGAWKFDVDAAQDWQIDGIVLTTMTGANAVATLSSHPGWNFVNDHFVQPSTALTSTVTLEIA